MCENKKGWTLLKAKFTAEKRIILTRWSFVVLQYRIRLHTDTLVTEQWKKKGYVPCTGFTDSHPRSGKVVSQTLIMFYQPPQLQLGHGLSTACTCTHDNFKKGLITMNMPGEDLALVLLKRLRVLTSVRCC